MQLFTEKGVKRLTDLTLALAAVSATGSGESSWESVNLKQSAIVLVSELANNNNFTDLKIKSSQLSQFLKQIDGGQGTAIPLLFNEESKQAFKLYLEFLKDFIANWSNYIESTIETILKPFSLKDKITLRIEAMEYQLKRYERREKSLVAMKNFEDIMGKIGDLSAKLSLKITNGDEISEIESQQEFILLYQLCDNLPLTREVNAKVNCTTQNVYEQAHKYSYTIPLRHLAMRFLINCEIDLNKQLIAKGKSVQCKSVTQLLSKVLNNKSIKFFVQQTNELLSIIKENLRDYLSGNSDADKIELARRLLEKLRKLQSQHPISRCLEAHYYLVEACNDHIILIIQKSLSSSNLGVILKDSSETLEKFVDKISISRDSVLEKSVKENLELFAKQQQNNIAAFH